MTIPFVLLFVGFDEEMGYQSRVPPFCFFRQGELIHSHTGAKEAELRANFLIHYTQKPQVQ